MGGDLWFYMEPYQADIEKALSELRQREFNSGRYFPAMLMFSFPFPVTSDSPAPGAKHQSIEEAIEAAEADGTGSILDMLDISDSPGMSTLCRLDEGSLLRRYGTMKPTRAMIEASPSFSEDIGGRGQGIYIVLYRNDVPDELLFAGYSYD